MTLIDNVPDAESGHLLTPHDRLREVVELASLAEELGFDALPTFGRREHRIQPFTPSPCCPPSTHYGSRRTMPPPTSSPAAGWHALQFFSVDSAGLPFHRKAEALRLTTAEVLPQLRHEPPDALPWPSAAAPPVPSPATEGIR
ncbi:LLM class flavin-dependent oxidoreductase [Streptomyces inhibens]|uniref:LLM class flavin-dependent oxidoreductase n=1 Tax=Streptomyces inhibens TaxID=2293571 RepID=UPI001EE74BAA|nr:LLM class flavin-dependent oxidoreductase [Streptomyces inhibens]UKY49315.1 LLM class flavin-dependent oxidoreductase [Streptomyces inhibens]